MSGTDLRISLYLGGTVSIPAIICWLSLPCASTLELAAGLITWESPVNPLYPTRIVALHFVFVALALVDLTSICALVFAQIAKEEETALAERIKEDFTPFDFTLEL